MIKIALAGKRKILPHLTGKPGEGFFYTILIHFL